MGKLKDSELILLILVINILGSGKMVMAKTEMEHFYGMMAKNTQVNGKIVRNTDKAPIIIAKKDIMKVGFMSTVLNMEYIYILKITRNGFVNIKMGR